MAKSRKETRRDQLAQQAGWNSRGQERYAKEKFAKASPDVHGKWNKFLLNKGADLSKQEERKAFRAFWRGLIDKRTNTQHDKHSARAEWFVEWLQVVDDYDTWDELYG